MQIQWTLQFILAMAWQVLACGGNPPLAGTGTVVIEITGAPAGDATITASGYSQSVTRTTVLTGVPVGTVEAVAREVAFGDVLYRVGGQASFTETRQLNSYAVARFAFQYEPVRGTLELDLSGLPNSSSIPLDIPGTGVQNLTNGVHRFELPPGLYPLDFPPYQLGKAVFDPDPGTAPARIASLQTTRIAVRYALVAGNARITVTKEGDDQGIAQQPLVCLSLNGDRSQCPF